MMERDLDGGSQRFGYSLLLAHVDRNVSLVSTGQMRAIWQRRNCRAKDGFKPVIWAVPIIRE